MKKEVLTNLVTLVTAAFGLVAALAWNGAIQELFKRIFGTAQTILGMFIYAIIVTLVGVWATIKVGKLAEKAK